jgi:hypothetical protein
MRALFAAAVVGLACLCAPVSHAASVLQFDLDGIVVDAGGAFSENYTGTLSLYSQSPANLVGVFLNGANMTANGSFTGALDAFTGTVHLVDGKIVGGGFSLVLVGGDSYGAQIVEGTGMVRRLRSGYFFEGLTFDGMFSSASFGGVDIQPWFDAQPLLGNFIEFGYTPNAFGFDNTANLDIFVIVPLPTGAGLAGAGLLTLACVRRRRDAATC